MVVEVAPTRPIGDILGTWATVLEPFYQDKEENDNQEGDNDGEGDEDIDEVSDLEEEGAKVKVNRIEKAPTKGEVLAHMLNYIPFRSWCEHCVKGKANGNPHRRRKAIEGESREAVVSIDYIFMHDSREEGEEQGMPIIVVKDRRTMIIRVRVFPQNGNHWYGIKALSGVVESLGCSKVILKSDQGPSVMSKDAVKVESRFDLVLGESPEYESKSSYEIESAIQTVHGQFRAMKDRLESRYCQRIGGERPCVPWLLAHASATVNRHYVYKDGRAAYEKWEGRE